MLALGALSLALVGFFKQLAKRLIIAFGASSEWWHFASSNKWAGIPAGQGGASNANSTSAHASLSPSK
jgi:hypothetical protein